MKVWDILRKVGAGLLGLSLVLVWFNAYWPALLSLIAIGGIDLALVAKDEDTISNWIHSLFPKKTDSLIMVGILAYTWYLWGAIGFLPMMMGVIVGHLFWNSSN